MAGERPALEALREYRRDPQAYLLRCAREDGAVVSFRIGPARVFALNDPELIAEVLVRRNADFLKQHDKGLPWGRAISGAGLLVSEGQSWLRQRRMLQPAFHRQRVAMFGALMVDRAERAVGAWRGGAALDVEAAMLELTLAVLAESVFGVRESAELFEALDGVFSRRPASSLLSLAPEWVPTPGNLVTRRSLRRLDRFIHDLIAERRRERDGRADLLAMLIEARDEDGGAMPDHLVRDEVMNILKAGYDTLGSTLAWTLEALVRHPHVERRLLDELHATLGPHPPRVDDLARLPYLDAVAREALRLFPAGKSIVRTARVDCELGGRHIPSGAMVVMSQWVVHRDPRAFERPEDFAPERWLDGLAERLPRFAYFPFGGGPRLCIGYAIADLMLRLVLAVMVRRVHLAWRDGRPATWDPVTLRPKRGLWMVPTLRA